MDRGFIYALLASFIWGCAPALEKTGLAGMDPFAGIVVRTIPIMILAAVILVVTGRVDTLSGFDARSAIFVAAGGVVAGLLGQLAFYWALKTGEASVVVPVAATYPLVALVVSVAFLGEAITLHKLAGIGLVVAGVVLLK